MTKPDACTRTRMQVGDPAPAALGMIGCTLPEIRRLLASLIQSCAPDPEHAWSWSAWRRRRQHQARLCHYRRRGYALRDSLWRGREFTSLAQMQAEAERWSAEVAGQRHCRPLDGAAPAAVFAAVEKPALAALPRGPFVLAQWSRCKVGPDIHASAARVLYSIPW